METDMRKRNHYKFTGKKHSRRAAVACFLAVLSLAGFIGMTVVSYQNRGQGSVYLGSAGILALAEALAAFIQAVKSLGEEESFRTLPVSSTLLSFLVLAVWVALYVAGFILS